jgi:L-amino acid N-acyltransferase YncA
MTCSPRFGSPSKTQVQDPTAAARGRKLPRRFQLLASTMIRKAIPADIESIARIYNEAIREGGFTGDLEPLSIENRQAWYRDHQDPYAILVTVLDDFVVGYAALSPYRRGRNAFSQTCEISYYFANQHRGLGLGVELINHAIELAGHSGFRLVVAMVLQSNQRSIDMLIKFGFTISGRLPNAAKINTDYVDHLYLSRCLTEGRPILS